MRVTRVKTASYKGRHRDLKLPNKNTVLVGPNGAGKTTTLESLRYAIQGVTPAGARPQDVMQYAGPAGCGITVSLDDGFAWSRGVKVDAHTHEVSQYILLGGDRVVGLREAQRRIAAKVGDFAPMFNLGAFLGLSDEARRQFVVDLCAQHIDETHCDAAWLESTIWLKYLERALDPGTVGLKCREHEDATPEDKRAVVLALSQALSDADRQAREYVAEQIREHLEGPAPAALAAALDVANAMKRSSEKAHQDGRAAARGLSARKAELPPISEGLDQLEERLAEQRTNREELLQQASKQEGAETARESLEQQLASTKDAIEKTEAQQRALQVGATGVPTDALETVTKVLEDADERAKAAGTKHGEAQAKSALAVARLHETTDQLAACMRAELNLTASLERVLLDEKGAKENAWVKARGLCAAFALGLADLGVPDSIGERFRKLESFLDKQADAVDLYSIRKRVREGRSALDKNQKELDDKAEEKEAAREELARLRDVLAMAEKVVADELEGRNALEAEKAKVEAAVNKCEAQAKEVNERLEGLAANRIDLERRLNDLDSTDGFVAPADLAEQIKRLEAAITALEILCKAKRSYLDLDREYNQAVAEAEKQSTLHEVCKVACLAIRDVRETVMADLIAPLKDRVNAFLTAATGRHQMYCRLVNDRGKPTFDLGWIEDGETRIPIEAMGGGACCLFGAGLAYALVALADAPLKVLAIEAAEMDDVHFGVMVNGLAEVGDTLSNIIICTHLPRIVPQSFDLIELPLAEETAEDVHATH